MLAGYRSVIVGTFHEMSPMSSDPPPVLVAAGPCSVAATFAVSPASREPSSFCNALASV
jgi:hypothetical protein